MPSERPADISELDPSRITRLLTRPDNSQVLAVPVAELRIEVPDESGKTEITAQPIEAQGLVIGSDPTCDVVLDDPAVSRRHCEIKTSDKGFMVRDLQSRNGTWVQGLRVDLGYLQGEETIRLGKTLLRFVLQGGETLHPISRKTSFGSLYGRSNAMRRIFDLLERAATSDATLLLGGESGTGKDLAAENVHLASARHDGPFVIVDCGAMQANLVESELFGHGKGAFTGAQEARAGAFERAHGGTVFLDEIGDLDLTLQPLLLRALERRETKRLGENHYRPIDVRVIAATHKNLATAVREGRFRQDLFYRLSVLQVSLPALRDRLDDLGTLAHRMVQKLRPDLDPEALISEPLIALMKNHNWPGNVRELRNVVERMLVFPELPQLALQDNQGLGPAPEPSPPQPGPGESEANFRLARQHCIEAFEADFVRRALAQSDGVVSHAAKLSGIPRQSLHRLMTKYGLAKS